jgi:FAD/FMN-containing dehydrogenase
VRNQPNCKPKGSCFLSDLDDAAFRRNLRCCLSERLVRADEVEHDLGRFVELFRSCCVVGTKRQRSSSLVGGSIHGDDPRIGQELQVLDRELAEPAAADDDRACLSAQQAAHATHRAIRSDPGIRQWGSSNGVDPHEREHIALRWNADPFGIAAVGGPAGFGGLGAQLLARQTEPALAATPARIHEDRPDTRHLAGDLVTEHQRQPELRPPSGRQVDIGVTDTGAAHADDHTVVLGLRVGPLLERKRRAEAVEDGRAQGCDRLKETGFEQTIRSSTNRWPFSPDGGIVAAAKRMKQPSTSAGSSASGDLVELRSSLGGPVLSPGDPGYDAARVCFNALVDRRPAVIAKCTGPRDVATAFDFARVHDLEVAVRGGGHNPAGHCVLDGGLVIDLSLLRAVEVDRNARTARAAGGSTWADFDSATQAHGLVTPGGVVGSTGVCGLTLGGGIGHLTAQHGLTCDNLIAAALVTPDGQIVEATETDDSELLWGLRGGGGNFGVATRLEFRLHRLDSVVGGMLVFGEKGAADALRRFRDVVASSPRELSCQAIITLDEALRPSVVVAPCYTGPESDPPELRMLRLGPGLRDDSLRPRSFLEQQRMFDSPYGENRHYWKGHFASELPDELIDQLVERIVALSRPPGDILIESLHGAPKDADAGESALGFRHAAFNISAMATWADADLDEQYIAWARETAAALEPWSVGGGYANYMPADEPTERARAAFGGDAYERLRDLKRRYDPTNVLHRNQNIAPGAPNVP